jgi:hypothetical protein
MFLDKFKRRLARRLITERDVKDSEIFQNFLRDYKELHLIVRELLRKYRNFEPPTSYEKINLISDGPALREEMAQLEKLIKGKDSLILHEREKLKDVRKTLKRLEEHYRDYLPQELLFAAFLHVHDTVIALDTDFRIIDFSQEAKEYFGDDIARSIPYHELFADKAEFNEYKTQALELSRDCKYFKMKIQFQKRPRLSTITESAYSESGSNGYITTLETEGKLKRLLQSTRNLINKHTKPVVKPKPATQN